MVLFLLRRDDTMKVAMSGALLAPLVLLPGPARGWSASFGFLQVVAFMVLVCAVQLRLDQRTTRFQVALPIAGRQLLMVRMIGTLLTIWLPVAAASLLLVLLRRDGNRQLLQGAVVLSFAALLPLTVRLRQAAISGWISGALFVSAAATGGAGWYLLPPLWHVTLFAALSLVLLLRACLAVPDTFEVSPRELTVDRPSATRREVRRPAWWPILRSVMPWLAIGLFLWGVFVAGNILLVLEFSFLVFQAGIVCRDRTRWLHALPLSRRVLLGITLVTTVAPYAAGIAFGTWIYQPPFSPHVRPRLASYMPGIDPHDRFQYRTNVPLEFWRYAPDGRVPAIQASWGESAQPSSKTILGFTFYNPYTAADRNSARFFEWQVANATETMYGKRMSFEQAEAIPYDATPEYPQQNRVDILTFATLSFCLLFGVYLRELGLSRWLGRTRFVRYLLPAAVFPIMVWLCLEIFAGMRQFGNMITGPLLQVFFMRIAVSLPHSPLAFAGIAALPSLAMYLLAQWQFARSETAGAILPSLGAMGRGMAAQ